MDCFATQNSFKEPCHLFPPKMFLILSSALSPSLSVSDLCLLFHPANCLTPSRTNSFKSSTFSYFPPSLSLSLPPELCQTLEKKKNPQANSQGQTQRGKACVRTHTHRHTSSSQPNSLYFSATLTLSTADFARSSLNAQCWSANRTHSTVLNMVRAIQPFLPPQTGSNLPSRNEALLVCSARLVWT